MKKSLEALKSFYINIRGKKTHRKLFVIESDDWGSVRMPSAQSYNNLHSAGIRVDRCGYMRYDCLESSDDLYALFEVFANLRNHKGEHPVITANTIVANPDYQKIQQADFTKYFFESFNDSYIRYQGSSKTLDTIRYGMKESFYFPQLHGREHLQISRWLKYLKSGDKETVEAFNNRVYGLSLKAASTTRKCFLPAFDIEAPDDTDSFLGILEQAQEIFRQHFGFSSESFIPPNYIWHPDLELHLKHIGVKYIQGGRAQKAPGGSNGGYQTIKHFMGEKNRHGQIYIIRNTAFEPSTRKNIDWRKKILLDVKIAFALGAPVVLSAHRVNFIGGIDVENRKANLNLFQSILSELLDLYPDIEFMNTCQLGAYLNGAKA